MEGATVTPGTMPAAPPDATEPGAGRSTAIDSIRALYANELRAEAVEWERDGGVPRSVFRRLAEAGAFEARWPDGALGQGDLDVSAAIVRETALASVGACVAIGTHLEAYFRALARCEYGREVWDDAIAGRRVGAMAVSEATGGSAPTKCETVAERSGDGWVLSGHKHYVSNMRAAGDCVVFTRTARKSDLTSFTLFVVPLEAEGVRITPHEVTAARASATAMLDLDEVLVPDERRVGSAGSGLVMLLELLRAERLGAASAGLAVAELCFEIALAFAERREMGGSSLRMHQAIAHRLAELSSEIAAGRALLTERLAAAREGRISSAEAGQVKLVLNRTAWRAADEAMQLLGGRGFTEETGLDRIWRDIRIGRIGGGTDEVQLELVAQSLRPGPLAEHPVVRAAAASADASEWGGSA
jgi:alkylation response protein AidB-like acyl-CoA dehydrogenase